MRPAAQERWIVCYDLECAAMAIAGYSELILDPENREKIPEIAERFAKQAKRVLELAQLLRFSGILEAETPPEVLHGGGWPTISASLRAGSSAPSPDALKSGQVEKP